MSNSEFLTDTIQRELSKNGFCILAESFFTNAQKDATEEMPVENHIVARGGDTGFVMTLGDVAIEGIVFDGDRCKSRIVTKFTDSANELSIEASAGVDICKTVLRAIDTATKYVTPGTANNLISALSQLEAERSGSIVNMDDLCADVLQHASPCDVMTVAEIHNAIKEVEHEYGV